MLPRVILHNSVSLDGRTTGFTPDIALHYEVMAKWKIDVHLAGSDTILAGAAELPPDDAAPSGPPEKKAGDSRSLLVIPDSRGRVRCWGGLRNAGYWRDVLALCSRATPGDYLNYLAERHIEYIVAGDAHVDFRAALEELAARTGAGTVLLDSGGVLNGVLLRAGLVSEISLLVHPCLAGGDPAHTFFSDPAPAPAGGSAIPLTLTHVEEIGEGVIWLRYDV